ncbi:MCE family protein [Mycobacterium terramassiliense]|uniref:ABC-type transporter Mla maintaining outer membrane lipid asymmetry, periplasmic component MlaD n=1 Tax=Mycobacterium terramassiliense TaxID=1841859 RepID=A0A2U3NGF3_9MYCO|nr:MCE family protein [Mycobacterium terramassiliense]SPM30602.1 ABC-type transporter Mla maintaining outer membrane lipid asymmetry, periplasmic component MlaD [Mycobacterium terramassiliense]
MNLARSSAFKFTAFFIVAALLTAFLFMVFSQQRTSDTNTYSAVFSDASSLKAGDTVRVAGIRVGTISAVDLQQDKNVIVTFDADRTTVLTSGTKAVVRYLNLVGDRYLELVNTPGSTRMIPAGSQIPADRTAPALDLDLLLGGLKPVLRGLSPADLNALTSSLLRALQDKGAVLNSVLSKTSSFTRTLADNNQTIEQVIDNFGIVVDTLSRDGDQFSSTVERLEKLMSGLAADRDPIGDAITALDNGTASIADLLGRARSPLKSTVDQLNRLAPLLDQRKDVLEIGLRRAPDNYRKLTRMGSYGSFVNEYICGMSLRFTNGQGGTTVLPWVKQETGRCAEP